MISHVEQRSSRRESRGWFFFLSRVDLVASVHVHDVTSCDQQVCKENWTPSSPWQATVFNEILMHSASDLELTMVAQMKGRREKEREKKRKRKGKEKMEIGSEALAETEKKSQTPQPEIEPGTPANVADAQPLSHRDNGDNSPLPSSSFPNSLPPLPSTFRLSLKTHSSHLSHKRIWRRCPEWPQFLECCTLIAIQQKRCPADNYNKNKLYSGRIL